MTSNALRLVTVTREEVLTILRGRMLNHNQLMKMLVATRPDIPRRDRFDTQREIAADAEIHDRTRELVRDGDVVALDAYAFGQRVTVYTASGYVRSESA